MPLVSIRNSLLLAIAFIAGAFWCAPVRAESEQSQIVLQGRNQFFVARSADRLRIRRGVEVQIERTARDVRLHMTIPGGAAQGDTDRVTVVCRSKSGATGDCTVSSTTHVAICGGADCCAWRQVPYTAPTGGGPGPRPPG
jgi:hypothetical protein